MEGGWADPAGVNARGLHQLRETFNTVGSTVGLAYQAATDLSASPLS